MNVIRFYFQLNLFLQNLNNVYDDRDLKNDVINELFYSNFFIKKYNFKKTFEKFFARFQTFISQFTLSKFLLINYLRRTLSRRLRLNLRHVTNINFFFNSLKLLKYKQIWIRTWMIKILTRKVQRRVQLFFSSTKEQHIISRLRC